MRVKVIELSFQGSLYDPASDALLTEIETVLASVGSGDVVILRALTACHDYHKSWLEGLSSGIYWEDLAAHFQRTHIALIGICVSRAKWYFVSGEDCLGSWWDLAIACHGRLWANPYSKVGFPEIYIDLIPPLSSGGLRKYAAYQNTDEARKNAILHAKDAYAKGLVSLVLQGQGWSQSDSFEVLAEWIAKTPLVSNLRATTKRELVECTPDLLGVVESRANLQQRRRQIALSHLEAGASSLKEKNLAARAQAMSSVRAGGAARLLFEDYKSWLSRRIARYELGVRDRWWSSGDGLLVIDLGAGIPPQAVLQAVLSRKIHLVFMSPEESHLKDAMETILSRFQRGGMARKEVLALWRGRVDWVVGNASKTSRMWLRCPPTDKIELGIGQTKVVAAYRLSGNFGQAGLGWVEILEETGQLADEAAGAVTAVREILDIISNGTLTTPENTRSIPLGVIVRIVLLSEMRRIAELGMWPDLVEQCKLLAAAGWGFASDIPQWDALLRGYGKAPDLPDILKKFGIESAGWLMSSGISDLRSQMLKNSGAARLDVSGARLSRHFEAFAIKIARCLMDSGFSPDQTSADLIVTLAWGYPGAAPLPSDLLRQLGPARAEEWLRT